jgi:hypothetical protein
VPDEQFVILEMRAVVGFRVQDQLGVRKKLLQDVGIDGWDDDVVAAVDDQDRKPEALGAQSQAEGHVEGFVCLPRWRSAELEGHVLVRRLTLDLLADRSGPVKEIIGSRGSVASVSIRLFGTCRMDHEPSCRSVSASSSSAGGCRFFAWAPKNVGAASLPVRRWLRHGSQVLGEPVRDQSPGRVVW